MYLELYISFLWGRVFKTLFLVFAPRFVLSGGTVVADDSARGDVDAVMSGQAAVMALPTWPQGHAFSLLDVVAVEALREDPATGLPLWLCEGGGGGGLME